MTPTEVYPHSVGRMADGQAATRCAACAHPWSTHDPIAARFCAATVVGGFTRGCVCTGAELPAKENKH